MVFTMRHVSAIIGVALALRLAAGAGPARGESPAPEDTLAVSLDESVRLALANNKDLMVTREKVAEASARVGEAGTAFFPQLTGSAGYTKLDMAPFFPTSRFKIFGGGASTPSGGVPEKITMGLADNYATQLKLQQPLFTGGKIKNAYDLARLAKSSADSELDLATSEIVFETKKAYLECIKAQKLEQVAAETVMQLEAHLKDLRAMFDAGLAATNDVLKTKVYYSDSKLSLMKARHAVDLARNYFCNIIGVPLTTEIIFTSKADSASQTAIDLEAAVAMGIERRAELKSMEFRKRMTREEIAINRSGYLPDVYFFANFGYQYPDREYARDFYSTWTVGVLAQMNVFDWGRTAYRTQQSKSRLTQMEITERNMKDAIRLDVTRSYLMVLDAWSGIEVSRDNVAQADENRRVTNERFKEGLATNTDLLDAEVLLTAAKTTYSNLMVAYLIAQADFARATGGSEN
jgi:outer membrane protein